jgi:hypothetical protein
MYKDEEDKVFMYGIRTRQKPEKARKKKEAKEGE